jgi:hypothetical protein
MGEGFSGRRPMMVARPYGPIGSLRRFVRAQPVDFCEFCGSPVPGHHGHLVEPATRQVACACLICGEALSNRPDGRYRLVPTRAEKLAGFRLGDAEWHSLGLPVEMAFLFHSTPDEGPIALYPGALGVAQAAIVPEAWAAVRDANPVLAAFEPDVEALLVDRTRGRRACYRVPIDRCYALAGTIRKEWQGFSGGDGVWQAIDDFLASLDQRPGRR